MTYDAVSAYPVLFGDGGEPTLTVHGSAEQAWDALDRLLRRDGSRGPRGGWWSARSPRGERPVDPAAVEAAAERWRRADPERRYWQVAPHRLRVTLPAIAH